MADPTGVIGLIGLFSTCLEGYKIYLSIKESDDDTKLLRTRMFVERERFLNIGRTCGLLHHDDSQKSDALKQYLAEDAYRRKGIADTLELIAELLGKAEDINRKYAAQEGVPEALKDNTAIESLADRWRQLKVSLKKVTWTLRDKAAYEDLIKHLGGFNEALEGALPKNLQQFLKTVLPATICATTDDDERSRLQQMSIGNAFLRSQVEWADAIHGVNGHPKGTELDIQTMKLKELISKDQNRHLAVDPAQKHFIVDWTPWERESEAKSERTAQIAGLLAKGTCKELCLLKCNAYVEETDEKTEKVRHGLVYELEIQSTRTKTLYELLDSFKTIQLPALETRIMLARMLCRAMLLYHSSGWIHHDFRSHNILFNGLGSATVDNTRDTKAMEYQGVNTSEPFIVGFGNARDEEDISLMFADQRAISKTLKQQKRYWSPDYLISSKTKRTNRSFQRSHDMYSLGCVLLEIGVWRPLESYSWESAYEGDHKKWHRRLMKEENKLRAMCGSRYAEAVMTCLRWTTLDIEADVQALAFDILLKLEEIVV